MGFKTTVQKQTNKLRTQERVIGVAQYLDQLAVQPLAVHSLRRMVNSATNSIRVRRSSDNAEQDIGFVGNSLDTTSLASFVGANSAYVTKFYDQTGGGFDLVQATNSKQPRIVNAGTYDGKAVFDGTDDSMSIASLTMGTPRCNLICKLSHPNVAGTQVTFELSANLNTNTQSLIVDMDSNLWNLSMQGSSIPSYRTNTFSVTSITALTQVSFLFDRALTGTAEIGMRVAGTARSINTTPNTTENSGNFTTYAFYVGARAGTSIYAPVNLETLAIYAADVAAIIVPIEAIVA